MVSLQVNGASRGAPENLQRLHDPQLIKFVMPNPLPIDDRSQVELVTPEGARVALQVMIIDVLGSTPPRYSVVARVLQAAAAAR